MVRRGYLILGECVGGVKNQIGCSEEDEDGYDGDVGKDFELLGEGVVSRGFLALYFVANVIIDVVMQKWEH